MNHNGRSSNRGLMASLGESTTDMLRFQDMTDNISIDGRSNERHLVEASLDQVGRLRQPINRRHSLDISLDQQGRRKQPLSPHKEHQKEPISPRKIKKPPAAPQMDIEIRPREIQLPPLNRGISRNHSSDATICSDVTFGSEISFPHHSSSTISSSNRTFDSDVPVVKPPKQPQLSQHLRKQSTEEPEKWTRPLVEVVPGFSLPFRGSKETIHAYHNDEVVHTNCKCPVFICSP